MGILIIDTCGDEGWVIYAENDLPVIVLKNEESKKHVEWLHLSIQQVLLQIDKSQLKAIAVTNGPGSYTGLRLGIAAAKGLAFVYNLPIITLNIFDVYYQKFKNEPNVNSICPMIDARRMEVYTTLFDLQGNTIRNEVSLILKKSVVLLTILTEKPLFCGSGAFKLKDLLINETEANINSELYKQQNLTTLAFIHLNSGQLFKPEGVKINYCKNFNELGQENWTNHE